ncbi:MAG: polymerase III, subunit gamma and tau protein [Candidatus Curtissbacteria bacterium GW2011_GWA1_40_9]|uniref:DNA polymerase III subunit gamma/tau n=1 Tax=Candidatus Curtissbacteria bacterium GW2011_GWA1_40_9 TaxID=1618408 RepID=A0A0G0TLP1_9BACT|nr:MAG: polymerase III, subunit gamma and tau protein [Candidatus Curtissbacteria bacterium GW2011_GWA1_40_9]
MVFYRKYRPQKLADLIGQEEISKTLLAQLQGGKVGHGYLFWGPKGTGKTSTARIMAKAVNCEVYWRSGHGKSDVREEKFGEPCNKCASCVAVSDGSFIDLIEIDAASNRGIDEVRDLREKVKLAPAMGGFKVYVIDEVHMLTNEAFNALLKTLEEPPKHVIFILATTEYSKVPPTIVSRLMKFNFRRAGRESLVNAISKIAKAEKIKISDDALLAIADAADGSYRDAVSILDQVSVTQAEVRRENVMRLVRLGGWDRVAKLVELVAEGRLKEAVLFVDEFGELGLDVSSFIRQVVLMLEKLLHIKIGVSEADLDLSGVDIEIARGLERKFSLADLQKLIRLLVIAEGEIKWYPLAHIPVVLAICKFCDDTTPVETVELGKSVVSLKLAEPARSIDRAGESKTDKGKRSGERENIKTLKQSKGKRGTTGEVEKSWGEFLNRVRPVNAHVFALLRATRPASYDGEHVTLEVFYRFHKDKLEEPKIIKMLDAHMAKTLGRKVRLKFTLAERGSRPTATVARSNVIETAGRDLEKIAQEIFSK